MMWTGNRGDPHSRAAGIGAEPPAAAQPWLGRRGFLVLASGVRLPGQAIVQFWPFRLGGRVNVYALWGARGAGSSRRTAAAGVSDAARRMDAA